MRENKVAQALHNVAVQVRAKFDETGIIEHRGEKGGARELLARDFLNRCLPGNVHAAPGGEIITASGLYSPQCDIVVLDHTTPPLLDQGDYRVVPNECVYGVIEVKSKLDKAKMIDACEKLRKVKSLPKNAFQPDLWGRQRTAYGQSYGYTPTTGMIFAFDGIDLRTLGQHFNDWCAAHRPDEWPDSVWILGKGYMQWTNPVNGRVDPFPSPGSRLLVLEPPPAGDVLLPMASHAHLVFAAAWMPPLSLASYLGDEPLGVLSAQFDPRTPHSEIPATEVT
ncbi:hypothetical protein LWC34_30185 [Kibdelosporangium philippinense]|uniref:DUF6602 domain-containing protein n=1 Tax=Kibdelosporangium philippinense TaxID=211113 RepID=A0ABS8ZGW4_9PSEU|nr:DUF6602 domain-containing protein [Kibdelosporangium philippinense]MCE7007065.1 hypothetical protein [Kibdelosporangium philippinense]